MGFFTGSSSFHIFFIFFLVKRQNQNVPGYLGRRENKKMTINRENITIVLVRPKYAGNIGSAARVAKNMGIEKILVVRRHEFFIDKEMEKIRQMSTHLATDVVEKIRYFDDLREAVSGFTFIVGTTARLGSARSAHGTPRELAAQLVDISQRNRVALLFGPEDFGLTNDDLKLCHQLITIPASERLKSINLSHAVMILCYELFQASSEPPKRFTPKLATSAELAGMYDQLKDICLNIGFLNPQNPDYWMNNIRIFLARIPLRSRDVKIIRGFCRQVDWYVKNKKT
jgi:tRNA/rRNA methyltransferase